MATEKLKDDDETHEPTTVRDSEGHSADSRTVRVQGISAGTHNLTLEFVFESKKKSGGGDIRKLIRRRGSSTALIEFEAVTVAQNVIKHGPLRLDDHELSVEIHNPTSQHQSVTEPGELRDSEENRAESKTVRVEGLIQNISDHHLHMFFTSKRASSGGDVRKITRSTDFKSALIEFEELRDAQNVLKGGPFQLFGQELSVTMDNHTVQHQSVTAKAGLRWSKPLPCKDVVGQIAVVPTTKQFLRDKEGDIRNEKMFNMASTKKGKACIICVSHFLPPKLRDLEGYANDTEVLAELWSQFGYAVMVPCCDRRWHLTAEEIELAVRDFSEQLEPEDPSAVVCLLSHGGQGYIYGSDGKTVSLKNLFNHLNNKNCLNMKGKPKVAIVQTFAEISEDGRLSKPPLRGNEAKIPPVRDLLSLSVYSTALQGSRSDVCSNGSNFTSHFVDVLSKHAKDNDLLFLVKQVVKAMTDAGPGTISQKAVYQTQFYIENCLPKMLYFFPCPRGEFEVDQPTYALPMVPKPTSPKALPNIQEHIKDEDNLKKIITDNEWGEVLGYKSGSIEIVWKLKTLQNLRKFQLDYVNGTAKEKLWEKHVKITNPEADEKDFTVETSTSELCSVKEFLEAAVLEREIQWTYCERTFRWYWKADQCNWQTTATAVVKEGQCKGMKPRPEDVKELENRYGQKVEDTPSLCRLCESDCEHPKEPSCKGFRGFDTIIVVLKWDKKGTEWVSKDGLSHLDIKYSTSQFFAEKHTSGVYRMSSPYKGKAGIISVHTFDTPEKNMEGYKKDTDDLAALWDGLGFQVFIPVRRSSPGGCLTAQEIQTATRQFAKNVLQDTDQCAVLCILSHGGDGFLYGSDMCTVDTTKLLQELDNVNCMQMAGKPKVVIIQACQGELSDPGVHVRACVAPLSQAASGGWSETHLPSMSDVIVGTPSIRGYASFVGRDSFFIRTLVKVFTEYACTEEICTLFTLVNRQVSEDTVVAELDRSQIVADQKQMPEFRSTLRKQLFLFPCPGGKDGQEWSLETTLVSQPGCNQTVADDRGQGLQSIDEQHPTL